MYNYTQLWSVLLIKLNNYDLVWVNLILLILIIKKSILYAYQSLLY